MTPQLCFSGPGSPPGRSGKLIVAEAKRTTRGTDKCVAVGDRGAPFRGDRLEVGLAVLVSLFFDRPAEANVAVFQFGLRSCERTCQFFMTTVVDMCTPLRFV